MAIDKNEELMGLTKADLVDIVAAAVKAANQLNPIEQRKYEQELAAQKRRDLAVVELGKIEEENAQRKKAQCTHSRYSMSHGKLGGHACAKGQGEWCTSGQIHNRNLATLICTRCSYTWQFCPTEAEYNFIMDNGMLGMAPPDASRIIKESVA
jgi:hypothetical protein